MTFGLNGSKLNSRPVYCSWLYGTQRKSLNFENWVNGEVSKLDIILVIQFWHFLAFLTLTQLTQFNNFPCLCWFFYNSLTPFENSTSHCHDIQVGLSKRQTLNFWTKYWNSDHSEQQGELDLITTEANRSQVEIVKALRCFILNVKFHRLFLVSFKVLK